MSRTVRVFIILVGVALFLVTTLIVGIILLPETDFIRDQIQTRLQKELGHKVEIGSIDTNPSFPELLTLTVGDVRVVSSSGRTLFEAGKIDLMPSLLPLLRKKISIRSINVEQFTVHVIREKDGRVLHMFQQDVKPPESTAPPAPAGSRRLTPYPAPIVRPASAPALPRYAEQNTRTAVPEKTSEKAPAGAPQEQIAWSVKRLTLRSGTVKWIDTYFIPGREIVITVNGIEGTARQGSAPNKLIVNVTGAPAIEKQKSGPVKIDGTVTLTKDMSRVSGADLTAVGDSVLLAPALPYLPDSAAPARQLTEASLDARLTWQEGDAPTVSLTTKLLCESDPSTRLTVSGDIAFTRDFKSLTNIDWQADAVGLPMKLLKGLSVENLPIRPEAGTVEADVEGQWKNTREWTAGGMVLLKECVPKPPLNVVGSKVDLKFNFKLNPDELIIENLEILGPSKISTLKGAVKQPFSSGPSFDIQGSVNADTSWLPAFGVTLPEEIKVKGPLPLHGSLKGKAHRMAVSLKSDLTRTDLRWTPHLVKPAGKMGSISFEGIVKPRARKETETITGKAVVHFEHTDIRATKETPPLSGVLVDLNSKVAVRGSRTDLTDAVLTVKSPGEKQALVVIHADVKNIGTKSPGVDGRAELLISPQTVTAMGLRKGQSAQVMGRALLKAKFAGSSNNLRWSLSAPLDSLDIKVQEAFRKTAGVGGKLSAAGTWASNRLEIASTKLDLPGISASGKGVPVTKTGKFGNFSMTVVGPDIGRIRDYVPQARQLNLTGPFNAQVDLKQVDNRVIPSGQIVLNGATLHTGGALRLQSLKGTFNIAGETVQVPGMTGIVVGPIQGPIRASGTLNGIGAPQTLNGTVNISMSNGRFAAGGLARSLAQAGKLVDVLLNQKVGSGGGDQLSFNTLTGTFAIAGGVAKTNDLRVRGPNLAAGVVGDILLVQQSLDLTAAVHTVVEGVDKIAQIPGVRDFLKANEGLLKSTGIAKELGRFGIRLPGGGGGPVQSGPVRTPITIVLKIRGPFAGPQVVPVVESAVGGKVMSQLKSLIHR
jgi:hypothetical protein